MEMYATTLSVQNGTENQVTRNTKSAYTCTSGECTEDLHIITFLVTFYSTYNNEIPLFLSLLGE